MGVFVETEDISEKVKRVLQSEVIVQSEDIFTLFVKVGHARKTEKETEDILVRTG